MDKQQVQDFAKEWINAWNSHDLEKVLLHYEETFEMSSPGITLLTGEASGVLKGKEAVGSYWAGALEKYPHLHFELIHVLRGANSVALVYQGVLGLSNEIFHFGDSGKVTKAFAHYDLESGCRGLLSPGSHNTPHTGPHGAFPSGLKGAPAGRRSRQSCLPVVRSQARHRDSVPVEDPSVGRS